MAVIRLPTDRGVSLNVVLIPGKYITGAHYEYIRIIYKRIEWYVFLIFSNKITYYMIIRNKSRNLIALLVNGNSTILHVLFIVAKQIFNIINIKVNYIKLNIDKVNI